MKKYQRTNLANNKNTKEEVKMLKFNLNEGEVIRKVKYTKDALRVHHHATHSFLKVLNHEGLLPRGYLTRVNNRHIKYETAYAMCKKLEGQSKYRIAITFYQGYYLIALVEKVELVEECDNKVEEIATSTCEVKEESTSNSNSSSNWCKQMQRACANKCMQSRECYKCLGFE